MSLRTRTKSKKDGTTAEQEAVSPPQIALSSPSLSQRAISQTLASTAHLANILPTGTLLAFQILTPIVSNNGNCDSVTRPLTQLLLLGLAVSCFLACFTDSFRSPDGQLYYGFATRNGMWLFDYPTTAATSLPDLSKYKARPIDWVHAVLSVLVFAVVALKDRNVLNCFYPMPGKETQEVLSIVPVAVGLLCSLLFVAFPTRRHGIGYPVTAGK
ncbi:protein DMP3 [Aristolochia californica]|uniref:protein DMP3 n=1 Tax=Aristolochia californica TaxID=171875 RepID=UPI0035DC6FDC